MSPAEVIERRILAAIRPVEATLGQPFSYRLRIEGVGSTRRCLVVYNRLGEAVLLEAPGLQKYSRHFETQPDDPAQGDVRISLKISDPSGRYLPRLLVLDLPRDTTPANHAQPGSVYQAVRAELYPAPSAAVETNWAVIRAAVLDRNTNERLPWTLLRVRNQAGNIIATGLADWRGEALLVIPGIPLYMPASGAGPALTSEIVVRVQAFFDLANVKKLTPADLNMLSLSGASLLDPNRNYVPDPAALAGLQARQGRWRTAGAGPANTIRLASGREMTGELLVDVPN